MALRLFPTRTEAEPPAPEFEGLPAAELSNRPPPDGLIEAALNSQSVLVFGQRPEELRTLRRRPPTPAPEQGLLFNWS